MPTVSPRYDIKSLIEHYANIQVVSNAVVHGVREYHSNCPWCGGTDRFIMRPETGQYTCSTRSSCCGRHGDAIDFLVEYMAMSKYEAMEELALEDVPFADHSTLVSSQSGKDQPPPKKWQEAGMGIIAYAERALWSSAGSEMLNYLRKRGLNDDTIKRKRFGYVPLRTDGRWYQESFETWGLDPEQLLPAQREKGCVRIPPGIIIPWFEGKTLWRLAIKRPGEPKGKDYGQVMGSGEGLYNVDTVQYGKPAMIVEAEFCAASVEQEAGDLIACVATGSTTRSRLGHWIADLSLASQVLQSFDEDEEDERGRKAGDAGAEFWLQTLKHCTRWSPMLWKDPNEILQTQLAGTNDTCTLRQWVQAGLPMPTSLAEVDLVEPLPITQTEVQIQDYAKHIQNQDHFERLCMSERVQTPMGPGAIWDMKNVRAEIERGRIRVCLDCLKGSTQGATKLFDPGEIESIIQVEKVTF